MEMEEPKTPKENRGCLSCLLYSSILIFLIGAFLLLIQNIYLAANEKYPAFVNEISLNGELVCDFQYGGGLDAPDSLYIYKMKKGFSEKIVKLVVENNDTSGIPHVKGWDELVFLMSREDPALHKENENLLNLCGQQTRRYFLADYCTYIKNSNENLCSGYVIFPEINVIAKIQFYYPVRDNGETHK